MKYNDYRWRVVLMAAVGLFVTTSCSREPRKLVAQGDFSTTNAYSDVYARQLAAAEALESHVKEMSPKDAAFYTLTNYPVIYKSEHGLFSRQCRRILDESEKEEAARLYAVFADVAITQQVSHVSLERRKNQLEGLWWNIFLCSFTYGQKGLVIDHNASFEYWERMFKFLDRVKDEIEDMKTVLDDGSSNRSRRKRQCVRSLAMILRVKMIRDVRDLLLGKEGGYADLLTDAQHEDILRRLSQYEEYSERTEEEIKGMIRIPSVDETGGKMQKELPSGRFDSNGAGDGIGF